MLIGVPRHRRDATPRSDRRVRNSIKGNWNEFTFELGRKDMYVKDFGDAN